MKTLGAILLSSFFTVSASASESLIYLSALSAWVLVAYCGCRRPDSNAVFRSMGSVYQREIIARLHAGARTKFSHPCS